MICWTVLSSERFNEKKKSPECLPASESASVPFETCQYCFLSVQACWAAEICTMAWAVLLPWLFLKASPCRRWVGAVDFRGKWGDGVEGGGNYRSLESPFHCKSFFQLRERVSCGEQSRGRHVPRMRTKSGAGHKRVRGEERGRGDLAGHSRGALLCLIRVGFAAGDAAADTPPCALQRHRGLGKER